MVFVRSVGVRGLAWTIRNYSLELWQGLVLHGMGGIDFHVFWKYWKLTSSPNTSKLVLGHPDWSSDYFGEWRTRFFVGVAHTIFFGSGAHDICWEWRTRYFWASWGPMGTHDSSWGPMGPHGPPWSTTETFPFFRFYYPWISHGFHGFPIEFSMVFPWLSHSIFHGFSMD